MATPAEIAKTYFDKLISEWGQSCTLIFQSGKTECPNCKIDVDTKRSSGLYQAGGPNPFDYGLVCPVCVGEGLVGSNTTANVMLNVNGDPKTWNMKPPSFVNVAKGVLLTWGFMSDLPAVLRSRRMVIVQGMAGEYSMAGEPFDNSRIVKNRYWAAWWERSGGTP